MLSASTMAAPTVDPEDMRASFCGRESLESPLDWYGDGEGPEASREP